MSAVADPLRSFAAEVGVEDPVTVVGGRTQWHVGGEPSAAREVRAPSGVVSLTPAEMTVRVRAGTPVGEVQAALSEHGQCVALPEHDGATVGGVLAVGRSDHRRLGRGPVRDCLLEVRYVSAQGELVRAGGPTVKNVSGFDLCRLFVGSVGTLGFAAEVVLRTRPRPEAARWLGGEGVDPAAVRRDLHAPTSILWDGVTTWVLLEGHEVDVAAQSRTAGRLGLGPGAGPPALPPYRHSVPPAAVTTQRGSFVAEYGVGVVHRHTPPPRCALPERLEGLHRRIKELFDPTGRLNPGRSTRS